jgi:hypothetical protein
LSRLRCHGVEEMLPDLFIGQELGLQCFGALTLEILPGPSSPDQSTLGLSIHGSLLILVVCRYNTGEPGFIPSHISNSNL